MSMLCKLKFNIQPENQHVSLFPETQRIVITPERQTVTVCPFSKSPYCCNAIDLVSGNAQYNNSLVLGNIQQSYTGSLWFKINSGATTALSILSISVGSISELITVSYNPNSGALTVAHSSSVGNRWSVSQTNITEDEWHHICWSMSDVDVRVAVDGSYLTVSELSSGGHPWTTGINNFRIGLGDNVKVTEVFFAYGDNSFFLDFSQQSKINKFWNNSRPVNLGADGSIPLGVQPQWYFTSEVTTGANAEVINKGSSFNLDITQTVFSTTDSPCSCNLE